MLDQLPAWLRHIIIMAAPVVLAEAAQSWIPWFADHYGRSLAGGIAVTLLTLFCTNLTTQYGVGRYADGEE